MSRIETAPLLSEDSYPQLESYQQLSDINFLLSKLNWYAKHIKNLDYAHPFLIPHYTVTGCLTGGALWLAFQLLGIGGKIPDLVHVLIAHTCGTAFLYRSHFAYKETINAKLDATLSYLAEIQTNLNRETCPYSSEKLQVLEVFLDEQHQVLTDQQVSSINYEIFISGLSRFTNANAEFAAGTTAITTFVVGAITLHYFLNDIGALNTHKHLTTSPWCYIPLMVFALAIATYEYIRADRGQKNLNALTQYHSAIKTIRISLGTDSNDTALSLGLQN